MRAGAMAVALLLVLSGCNAVFAGSGGEREATVTPAPVPTAAETRSGGGDADGCVGPRPVTPDPDRYDERATPATPKPLPRANESVRGHQLVGAHNAALRNYSYHLRAGDSIEVWSRPGARAFSYQGIYVNNLVSVYVINGTRYSVSLGGPDRGTVQREPYRPGNASADRIDPVIGVSFWLTRLVGSFDYRYVGTRQWNGTTVRVYRDDFERPSYVRLREIVSLNSTIYVGPRGVIRWIDHRELYRPARGDAEPSLWRNETFVVPAVGTHRFKRPSAFCGIVGRISG